MTGYIEILNHWGENFWAFAWPMLWQSSLLIAIVFAFDALFARHVRAAVRYALWMIVLVKLLLPPSLALPTGVGWWLWPAKPVLAPIFQNNIVTVSTSVAPLPVSVSQTIRLVASPPPELSGAGWAVLGCGVVGMILLFWLIFRWLRVAVKVRRAPASGDFAHVIRDAKELGRLRHYPRLKLVEDVQSPAVYGLFRPVILLPRALAEKLTPRQLRAVLLHEVIHLRRGDVWVNCAQTLLQIAYWWHPLLWLANARIRHVREEAVDDAVMFALRDGADAYAPTLLEVAKFAFRRPLASLGLVGILEPRSALRQRVERLADFRPPRKVGVTLLSLCGIFAFCAVALPMGQAPATALSTASAGTNSDKGGSPVVLIRKSQALFRALNRIHIDVSYTNAPLDEVLRDLTEKSYGQGSDSQGINFTFEPYHSRLPAMGSFSDRGVARSNIRVTLTLNNVSLAAISEAICRHCDHPVISMVTDNGVVFSDAPYCEMRTFKVGTNVFFTNLRELAAAPISTSDQYVTTFLTDLFNGAGIYLFPPEYAVFDGRHGGDLLVNATPRDMDIIERVVEILHEAGGGENRWLESINHPTYLNRSPDDAAGTGSKDSADDSASMPNSGAELADASDDLYPGARTFRNHSRTQSINHQTTLVGMVGADFRNVLPDPAMDAKTSGPQVSSSPPLIHIKARFIEVPQKFLSSMVANSSFPGLTNGGILPNPEFRAFLREAESQHGTEELAEPEATSIIGRQLQMRATIIQPVVTNFTYVASGVPVTGSLQPYEKFSDGSSIVPMVAQVETGQIVDVVPNLLADGYTTRLKATASVITFLGYANSSDLASTYATNAFGKRIELPSVRPRFHINEASMDKFLYDGQTLVLLAPEQKSLVGETDKKSRGWLAQYVQKTREQEYGKFLVVFVTATLIDPAGNRSHSDDEMSFAQNRVPPQSP